MTALTRRRLLVSVASLAAVVSGRSEAQTAQPSDRGIGGTGVLPQTPGGEDRGIGGTGVVGTIRRFGSIWVNGLRIAYPKTVAVFLDGQPADASALRIGQMVQVVATPSGRTLRTERIDVRSEVVGRVESIDGANAVVAGQRVQFAPETSVSVGERVAIGGLRRLDGTIVASSVEPRAEGQALVAGPVTRGADGMPAIGGLRLQGLDPALVGSRAIVNGPVRDDVLAVASARRDTGPTGPDVRRLSIESFASRGAGGLRLGSGFDVRGSGRGPVTGSGPVVLTTRVDPRGGMQVDRIRPAREGATNAPGSPRGDGRPAGGERSGFAPGGGPGQGPGRPGSFGPGQGRSPFDGGGRGPSIDTRTIPGMERPSGPGGFGGGGGGPGGGGFGGGGPGGPGGGPGGFGGPSGFGGPGGMGGGRR